VDQFVKDTIAQVPEFLARNRKLISPQALVASYRYARFMEIVEVAKEFLLGILGKLPHPFTYLSLPNSLGSTNRVAFSCDHLQQLGKLESLV